MGYVQELERGNYGAALTSLQQDLGSLNVFGEERLHQLAGCMLCNSPQALHEHLLWPGTADNKNRKQLLRELQVSSFCEAAHTLKQPPISSLFFRITYD